MSQEDEDIVSQRGEILFYQAEDGTTRLECRFEDETIWLSQAMLCELYQKSKATISEHLKNIFQDNELQEDSVVRFFRTTAADGKEYNVKHFNLDAILAVGYRLRSQRGTQFRRWATERNRQVLRKVKHYNPSTVIPAKLPVIPAQAGIQRGCLHG